MGDEFWPVIHPDHPRELTMRKACHIKELDHRNRIDLLVDCESDVFAGVFIDNATNLDHLTMLG